MLNKGSVVKIVRFWGEDAAPPEGYYGITLNSANNPWEQVRLTVTDGKRQYRHVALARDLKPF